ncbi:MAG TPA: ShlB/FhaC/HecB family hemolysin secretion/activation protein [Steroidobacteraceae bacterium]|jgi:hemolysin activation/secretion protein|nr:ShlB/FhaC/HecB family hemolysin secretion/activation protein [Steroidobacteraceae bacterium]
MKSSNTHRFATLLLTLTTGAAWAQVTIPSGVEPGQIQRSLERMRVPQHDSLRVAPPTPQQVAPDDASQLKFVLRSVTIEGATVYKPGELDATYKNLIGTEIDVGRLFALANQLTARYRNDGYVLSQVLVPAQGVVDGKVKLLAVEGFIAQVQYRGKVPADDALLAAYSARLRAARPLTAHVLERGLLLMNDLGHVAARGTLVPSADQTGAADLIVDFARDDVTLAVAANNRNSRALGSERMTLDFDVYGLMGHWDHLSFKGGSSLSNRLSYAGVGFGTPLGHDGMYWNIGATGARSKPGKAENITTADLEAESLAGSLQIGLPVYRSRAVNLNLRASLTTFDGHSEFSSLPLSEDRIRAARIGAEFDWADGARGVTTLDVEYSQGLDSLGARLVGAPDNPLSRESGRADFSKVTLYAARLQSLGGHWSALLAASAQHAFDTLLAPELFAVGGDDFGRGYDPSELAGDSGEAAKFELRYAGALPALRLTAYTVYGFYDWGQVRRLDPINELAREHATSAGAGLRFSGEGGAWQGFVEFAAPLDHDVAAEGNRDARVFLGLLVSL